VASIAIGSVSGRKFHFNRIRLLNLLKLRFRNLGLELAPVEFCGRRCLPYCFYRIGQVHKRIGCDRIAGAIGVGSVQVELPDSTDPLFSQDGSSELFKVLSVRDHAGQLRANTSKI
jgi:hypothetical protein